jgi:hypothetical protein
VVRLRGAVRVGGRHEVEVPWRVPWKEGGNKTKQRRSKRRGNVGGREEGTD